MVYKRMISKNINEKSLASKRSSVELPHGEIDSSSNASSDKIQRRAVTSPRSPPILRSSVRQCGGRDRLSLQRPATAVASTSMSCDHLRVHRIATVVTSTSVSCDQLRVQRPATAVVSTLVSGIQPRDQCPATAVTSTSVLGVRIPPPLLPPVP